MSFSFAATITPDCVSFTGNDGKNFVISASHANNLKIREAIKDIQRRLRNGLPIFEQWANITALADVAASIVASMSGRVRVVDGVVYYLDEAIHSTVSRRILWAMNEGYEVESYLAFLDKLMDNPSKRAVDELLGFLEACNNGICQDGDFLAYKKVRKDYKDIRTGTFDNSIGQILEMPRNRVDEDKNNTCSTGFHFCSMSYLPFYASSPGNKVMIVKVNPRDVVAIPADYRNAKGRACRYEVVGEYTGNIEHDPLSDKPVWASFNVENLDYQGDLLRALQEAVKKTNEVRRAIASHDDEDDDADDYSYDDQAYDAGLYDDDEGEPSFIKDDDLYGDDDGFPEVTEQESSFVKNYRYDSENETLFVELPHGTYAYQNVSSEIAYGMETAQSKGSYFNQNIRSAFPWVIIP